MNIKRSANEIGGLQPEAVVTLSSISPLFPVHNTEHAHKLRHPLGAYNVSLISVISNFNLVLQQLYAVIQNLNERNTYQGCIDLMECQKYLLRSLDEHADDCEKILKAFFAKGMPFHGTPHVEEFKNATQPYFKPIREIVNHLKHSQGRVRAAMLITDMDKIIPTYYIEGIDDNGHPGPDPQIHNEPYMAFSFYRDLKYHFCNLYGVSAQLSRAIIQIVGSENVSSTPMVNSNDTQIALIADGIAALPSSLFLPHERVMDIPSVGACKIDGVFEIMLALPASLPNFEQWTKASVLHEIVSDGITTTFRTAFKPNQSYPAADAS